MKITHFRLFLYLSKKSDLLIKLIAIDLKTATSLRVQWCYRLGITDIPSPSIDPRQVAQQIKLNTKKGHLFAEGPAVLFFRSYDHCALDYSVKALKLGTFMPKHVQRHGPTLEIIAHA